MSQGKKPPHGRPISVLLVDDDQSWTNMIVEMLEETDGQLSVTTAHDEREARKCLNDADFDCVVSDYGMPGASGLELLKRFRQNRPGLAHILITSRGSEQIASKAIAMGLDDYLPKQNAVEHPELFVNRIRNTVTRKQTQQKLQRHNEYYSLVAESIAEAICIYVNDSIFYANDQFYDLIGADQARVESVGVSAFVNEDDKKVYETAVLETPVKNREVRVVDSAGNPRRCLLTTRHVSVNDETATICVFRDVTARRQRERALRLQLAVSEEIWEVLAHDATTQEVATRFCTALTERAADCDLALVVTPDGDTDGFQVASASSGGATSGAGGYEETLTGGHSTMPTADPSICAFETGDPVISRGTEQSADRWRSLAEEHGLRSAVAVPIADDGVTFGAVGVYSGKSQPDIPGAESLENLAKVLGHAFSTVEMRNSLMTDAARYARVRVGDDQCALADLAGQPPLSDAEAEITMFLTGASTERLYGRTQAARDAVADTLETCSRVAEHETETAPDGATRFRIRPTGTHTGMVLAENQAVPESASLASGGVEVTARLSERTSTSMIIDALNETFAEVDLLATGASPSDHAASRSDLLDPLTDRQLDSIHAAYRRGYFEQPKQANAEEIASDLDISRTTFTQHLRSAERKLLAAIFEDNE